MGTPRGAAEDLDMSEILYAGRPAGIYLQPRWIERALLMKADASSMRLALKVDYKAS